MNWRALSATIRILPTVSLPLTLGLALAAAVQPGLGLGFMLAVGQFVGQIPELVAGDSDGWAVSLTMVAGFYLTQQLVGSAAGIVQWRLGQRLNHYLDDRVMAAMLTPPGIAHLENARTRDLAAEVADGLAAGRWRPSESPGALFSLVGGVLGISISFAVVLWLQWWLGLLLIAVTVWVLRAFIRQAFGMLLKVIETEGDTEFRRLEYERDTAVAPSSAKEVRLFGYAPWVLDRWQARLLRVLDLDLRKLARLDPSLVVAIGVLTAVVGGGFAWVALLAGRGELGLAAATVLAQALLSPLRQVEPVGQAYLDLARTSRPVQALLDLENTLGEAPGGGSARPQPCRGASGSQPQPDRPPREDLGRSVDRTAYVGDDIQSEIRLENVGFHYPGTEVDVLTHVDLEIPAGSSLAIVGVNGAGKTTLVKLLCRFYDPTAGRITVDGTDLRELDHAGWQRRVAAIFQDFARFPMSARDNIGIGALGASDERIEAVARRSGAATLLTELPHGWDTVLSREFSNGTDLSGGQWQRVALSRAVLAADAGADLLILDEPAANLDVRAEADLNRRFLDLTQGVTTIVISHRFSTVRQAERICVLNGGHITELGSHEELLATGGQYARMFRLQAERFTA